MNKWFNRNAYALQLLNNLINGQEQKAYSSFDLYMIASAGIKSYSEQFIRELLCNYFKQHYDVYVYENRIKEMNKQIEKARNEKLKDIDPLTITKPEIEIIKQVDGILNQRLLFTLLCMAKYNNALHGCDSNWVNAQAKEIFTSANVRSSRKAQDTMIYILAQSGLISNSMKITSNSIRVNFITDGEEALKVDDLRGLGAVYMNYIGGVKMKGKTLKKCKECGIPFIAPYSSETNARQYCKKCQQHHS